MKQGKLVPDEVIFELLTKRLENGAKIGEKGFILDGFPRTTRQAVSLVLPPLFSPQVVCLLIFVVLDLPSTLSLSQTGHSGRSHKH